MRKFLIRLLLKERLITLRLLNKLQPREEPSAYTGRTARPTARRYRRNRKTT